MAFQHVPTLQSTGRLLMTPQHVPAFPLLPSVPPAPLRGGHRIVVKFFFCFRCALYAIWDLSPPLPAASFRSGCRTVVILCLRIRRHNITTVRQPERKEAAGSGGDRSQMAYKAHLKQKKNFTTIRWPPRSGAGGTDGSKGKAGTCCGVISRRPVDCKVGTC